MIPPLVKQDEKNPPLASFCKFCGSVTIICDFWSVNILWILSIIYSLTFFLPRFKIAHIEICSRSGLQKWHQEFSNKLEVIASSHKIKLQGCNIQHKNIINNMVRVLYVTVARLGDYFLMCINVEPLVCPPKTNIVCRPPKTNVVCQLYST